MFFRKTINKTKYFFHKTFENLKSLIFGGYQKLPKAQPLTPFLINNQQMHHLDNFYTEFSELWESDSKKVSHRKKKSITSRKEPAREEDSTSKGNLVDNGSRSAEKNTQEETGIEENNKAPSCSKSSRSRRGRDDVFAEKMKELEKMDVNDVDHVLDIEEIIHYYSRLTCPVYLDLVDTFFTEIYSDFFLPNPSSSSATINTSIKRISPV